MLLLPAGWEGEVSLYSQVRSTASSAMRRLFGRRHRGQDDEEDSDQESERQKLSDAPRQKLGDAPRQKAKILGNKQDEAEDAAGHSRQLSVLPEDEEGETTILGGYEQLASIIRNRGYHVKDHVPKEVLDAQIMENIRRREKIALLLRMQEVAGSPPPLTVPLPKKEPPPPPHDPVRTAHTLALITKVSTFYIVIISIYSFY